MKINKSGKSDLVKFGLWLKYGLKHGQAIVLEVW